MSKIKLRHESYLGAALEVNLIAFIVIHFKGKSE